MSLSDVDHCNNAIGRVGGEPIEALDDGTPLGAFCLVQWPLARDWALGLHRWQFAVRIEQLAEFDTPEARPLAHVFALPSDMVGQGHAYRGSASIDAPHIRHFMCKEGVATDCVPTFLEYTRRTPEAQWPAWFSEFIITLFASGVARNSQSLKLAQALKSEALGERFDEGVWGGKLLAAMQADGGNAPERALNPWDPGPLVCARMTPYGGYGGLPLVVPSGSLLFVG